MPEFATVCQPREQVRVARVRPGVLLKSSLVSQAKGGVVAGKIQLDVDGVSDLASRFRRVADELRSAKQDFNDDGSIRSKHIDDALGDFNGDWSDKRRELLKALDDAAKFLDNVVQQLTAADKALSDAVKGRR